MQYFKSSLKSTIKPSGLACTAIIAAFLLSGCANQLTQPSQSVAHIKVPNKILFKPAPTTQKAQKEIVKQYIPVPVQGQWMPKPQFSKSQSKSQSQTKTKTKKINIQKKSINREAVVRQANQNALVQPKANDFFNAMMTYDYMPGAMYVVYTAPMRITDIALAPGEKIISEAAGDTLRWQVSQTYSGQGSSMRQHILVKPNSSNLTNTMIITTNKRVYHLLLKSTSNNTFMMSVQWKYPSNMVKFSSEPNGQLSSSPIGVNTSGSSGYQLNLANMNFNYQFGLVKGQKPAWYPVRVFSSDRQTFIQFPESAAHTNTLPVLFVGNNQGQYGSMVNWQIHWPYLVVNGILKSAQLRSGVASKDNQVVVQIQQTQ